MPHTLLAQVSTLLAIAVSAWAIGAGRWPERLAAASFGGGWIASVLFQDHRLHHHLQDVSFAMDVELLAATLFAVLLSRRTWVLWGGACALLMVLTHVAMALDARFGQWTYLTAAYVWSFGFMGALACGVFVEGRSPVPPVPLRGWILALGSR
jgi:hypothetical protein